MDLRLRERGEQDPSTVPLPNGTEVTTRAEREAQGHTVPAGSVGRVVGRGAEGYDVLVLGVGVLRFAREELVPRKLGQLQYALRREAAWRALRPCVVLSATVGSRAWGLAEEGSDTDKRGALALPFAWGAGLGEPPGELLSEDGSETYWTLEKFLRQALRADPNTLEPLFVDEVEVHDELGQWLLDARDAFVSREVYGTFGRFAVSQLRRLSQLSAHAEDRVDLLTWLREEPVPTLDELAARLAARERESSPSAARARATARERIKHLGRSLFDQGLTSGADLAAMTVFARSDAPAALDTSRELRPKNAYNLLRLLVTAIEWLETGTLRLRLEGAWREELRAIKKGAVPLAEVLSRAEQLLPRLDEAHQKSVLPQRPDVARADALLRRARRELARRAVLELPGVWGRDAPEPPALEWG